MLSRRDAMLIGATYLTINAPDALAQSRNQIKRVAYLSGAASDKIGQATFNAFLAGLEKEGWNNGGNVAVDPRWAAGDAGLMATYASELIGATPDVMVVETATALAAVLPRAGAIPIVFVSVSDPIGNGFVKSLADPGSGITGFSLFDYPMIGKWLEYLKYLVPSPVLPAVMMNPRNPNFPKWLAASKISADSLGISWRSAGLSSDSEIRKLFKEVASQRGGCIIALPDPYLAARVNYIVDLANEFSVPVMYPARYWCDVGGLISYGIDQVDINRRAAVYVHKILQGAAPGSLPVQRPTKFELVINLKTAKALNLNIPDLVSAQANEVIE